MKNKVMLPLILLFLSLSFAPLQGQGFIVQKDIIVGEDEVQDNVMSFGGTISVKGKVQENVIAFGGMIIIEGKVEETVLGFGSKILLKSTAEVKGDLVSIGGTLDKESGADVKGDTVHFSLETTEDVREFFRDGLFGITGISLIPLLVIFKLITLFIWFILAIALAAIFPRQISSASTQIRKSFWSVFGIGILSIIIYTGLVIFSVLLSFVLIGIPILLCLIFIGIITKIFGRIILFYFFGESITRAFSKKQPSVLVAVILGFLLLGFISFIPIIGSLFGFFLSIVGWGVVIRTKFGTTTNWFSRNKIG